MKKNQIFWLAYGLFVAQVTAAFTVVQVVFYMVTDNTNHIVWAILLAVLSISIFYFILKSLIDDPDELYEVKFAPGVITGDDAQRFHDRMTEAENHVRTPEEEEKLAEMKENYNAIKKKAWLNP